MTEVQHPAVRNLEPHSATEPLYNVTDKTAFSHANILRRTHLKAVQDNNVAKGVRRMPYPFSSAMAVVSDLDATSRARFEGYKKQLVGQLGLDFGDSFWLQRRHGHGILVKEMARETGFFSQTFGFGNHEAESRYWFSLTFNEALREFHRGNLDHFHSLLSAGPRALILNALKQKNNVYTAPVGVGQRLGQLKCRDIVATSAAVYCADNVKVLSVTLKAKNGGEITSELTAAGTAGVQVIHFWNNPRDHVSLPEMSDLSAVVVNTDDGSIPAAISRIVLLVAPTDVLLDRLSLLQKDYGVETCLVTDHASYHFRNENSSKIRDRRMRVEYEQDLPLAQSIHGSFYDDNGNRICTTDADDPESLSRVFPELSDSLGVRFVNPAGCTASSSLGWDPLNLVTPAITREGGGIYVARRTLPNVETPPEGQIFDGIKSRQQSFVKRIENLLDIASATPNLIWPMYTHIGAITQAGEGRRQPLSPEGTTVPTGDAMFNHDSLGNELDLPNPYFESSGLEKLQNHVFNIGGDVTGSSRMWFTRASVLYDYALINRSIANHIHRPAENHIVISPWYDPILDRQMPVTVSQLYGTTLYVEDSAKALVFLGDEPVNMIARNPADDTGKQSVTIMATDFVDVLFDQPNPAETTNSELIRSRWQWQTATDLASAYGRLLTDHRNPKADCLASLCINLHSAAYEGAQFCSFRLRQTDGAKVGVSIATSTGGSFIFGNAEVLEARMEMASAWYQFDSVDDSQWRTIVIPFHDLQWQKEQSPGGPMPSHQIDSITLLLIGDNDKGTVEHVDIGEFCFHRPRVFSQSASTSKYCMTGCFPQAARGDKVALVADSDGSTVIAECDARGYFNFTGLTRGIYCIRGENEGVVYVSGRGEKIEVCSNQVHVVLDSVCP